MSHRPARRESPNPARVPDLIEGWSIAWFAATCVLGWLITAGLTWWMPWFGVLALPMLVYTVLGLRDMLQVQHSVRRNFPVLGRLRYVLESLRPEIRQYFVESDEEENPISRERRSVVYARAKGELDTMPFGTRHDVYRPGYEWINHSLAATSAPSEEVRIRIGEHSSCTQPYSASLLNVSAMSYGALSANAVLALNAAAREGGFYHNTGEGGVSPYHLQPGGDLTWQVGTGYFGCRANDGGFDPDKFVENATRPSVKMIELKLSQGAKPGHGGILPGRKVTQEISEIRGVPMGQDVVSPPAHRAFSTPRELMQFVQQLRELSGGKPVGFKLCIGSRREFLSVLKAMLETDLLPDFITVDGGEGGTGAAPMEFSNSVGMPLVDGLVFVHHALIGAGLRDRLKVVAAGKITTGFHVVRLLALGADLTCSARAMMLALGCIQALKCNTNQCPVGVATQDPRLMRGLVVADKAQRVRSFHDKTVEAVYELLGAAGVKDPNDLRPYHVLRRLDDARVCTYEDLFPTPASGAFLEGKGAQPLQRLWDAARPDRFSGTAD